MNASEYIYIYIYIYIDYLDVNLTLGPETL